jgi:uncharacterized protein YgiM (DUF1202 family)
MKNKYRIILGALLSASLLAQPVAYAASTTTNAPAAKAEKKKSAKKKTEKKAVAKKALAGADLKTVPLAAGQAVVVASNVNVRGQAKLNSEVVTRLTKGQHVTVLEEIVRNTGPDEPSAWAKIVLPPAAHVWVNTIFIEGTNRTVKPKKLKVRAGPGEEYSTLGMLKRGDAVKEMGAKGDWMEIEAPTDAYAFMAAQYLKQEVAVPPAVAIAEPPVTPVPVPEPPIVPPPTTEPPVTPATNEPPAVTPATNEPPPKRIVQREGFVRGTFSIQAPSHFELISPENRKTMNYLYTNSKDLDLRRYKGMRIIVTGEEALDERWPNIPVITIQRIQVLE